MQHSLTIFFMLLSFLAHAQTAEKLLLGPDPRLDDISDKYEAGPYLMYDCQAGHWVCVIQSHFERCVKDRARDIRSKEINLTCAPFESFPNKISCFQRQFFMVSQAHGNRFCINDEWKERAVSW